MRAEDQFHVGIVVDDLDATLAHLTDTFGYQWCDQIAARAPVALPTGDTTADLRFTYSTSTPRLEIIQAIPGTVWTPAPGSGIHHLGYWSGDVPRDAATLEQQGYQREAAGTRPDGTTYWAYLRAPTGPRIELVTTALQPTLSDYWTTGKISP